MDDKTVIVVVYIILMLIIIIKYHTFKDAHSQRIAIMADASQQ